MKTIHRILVAFVAMMVLTCFSAAAASTESANAQFADGDGSIENPYQIANKYHLNNIRNYPQAHFVLVNDIVFSDEDFEENGDFYNYNGTFYAANGVGGDELTDYGWIAIDNFTGVLDGNGYAIINLRFSHANKNAMNNYYGLFSQNGGVVKNLGMENCDFLGHSYQSVRLGGICGVNNGTIYNCYVTGRVTIDYAFASCGGICGVNEGIIKECINMAEVTAVEDLPYAAGIAEYNTGKIEDCINYGRVVCDEAGINRAAGIAWWNSGEILRTINYGQVVLGSSSYDVKCFAAFVGDNTGKISDSYYYKNFTPVAVGATTGETEITFVHEKNLSSQTYAAFDTDDVWGVDPNTNTPYLKNNKIYQKNMDDFSHLYATADDLVAEPYTYKSIKLRWKEAPGASGYIIYRHEGASTHEGGSTEYGSCQYREVAVIEGGKIVEYVDGKDIEANSRKVCHYKISPYYVYDDGTYKGVVTGFASSKVVDTMSSGGNQDITVPTVTDFEILETESFLPGLLKAKLDVSDEGGIASVSLTMEMSGASDGQSYTVSSSFAGEKQISQVVEFPLSIGVDFGDYYVTNVEVRDMCGNVLQFDARYFDDKTIAIKKEFDIEFEGILSNSNIITQIQMMEEGKTVLLYAESSDGILKKELLDAIKGADKTIVVYCRNDGSVQWVVNGKDIKDNTKDVDVNVSIKNVTGKEFGASNDMLELVFADNGELPGNVNFRLKSEYIQNIYKQNKKMYLYYFNNGGLELENEECKVFEDQDASWCYVDLHHNSTFYLSGEKIKNTDTPEDTVPSVPMYRMYDPNSGEHFYTGSEEERDILIEEGWQFEGVAFNFPAAGAPVYRLYDDEGSGDHLYTMDQDEIDRLVAEGWNNEGVAFNSASASEVPQYRLYNPNAHLNGTRGAWHFTGDEEERDFLISLGWQYQGIGWYSEWV